MPLEDICTALSKRDALLYLLRWNNTQAKLSSVCDKTKKMLKNLLKNLLHMSLRVHKPQLNYQIGYQCFDNKWIPSSLARVLCWPK